LEYKEGDDAAAARLLEQALQVEPDHIGANIKLAELLQRAGQYDQALAQLARVPENGEHRPNLLSLRAIIQLAAGRPEQAEQTLETLTTLQPGNHVPWNNLGNAKRDLGKLDEADACYLKAASLTRNTPQPLSNRLTNLHYRPDITQDEI